MNGDVMRTAAREVTDVTHDQGRDTAFDRLFRAEYGVVLAIATRVLGDRDAAEDVAQDVFLSFHRQSMHSAEASFAPAWLRAAAVHAALDVLRGQRRRGPREKADATAWERIGSSTRNDPAELVAVAEQRLEVRTALARLPDRSASVLVLRHSGLSYVEVAMALSIPVNQVGMVLKRAESALRKEMTRVKTPR